MTRDEIFAAEDMRIRWSNMTTPDFPDKTGVRSTHLIQLGRGNGNGKVAHPVIRVVKMPAVRAYSNSRIQDQSWHGMEEVPPHKRGLPEVVD